MLGLRKCAKVSLWSSHAFLQSLILPHSLPRQTTEIRIHSPSQKEVTEIRTHSSKASHKIQKHYSNLPLLVCPTASHKDIVWPCFSDSRS